MSSKATVYQQKANSGAESWLNASLGPRLPRTCLAAEAEQSSWSSESRKAMKGKRYIAAGNISRRWREAFPAVNPAISILPLLACNSLLRVCCRKESPSPLALCETWSRPHYFHSKRNGEPGQTFRIFHGNCRKPQPSQYHLLVLACAMEVLTGDLLTGLDWGDRCGFLCLCVCCVCF